MRVGIVTLFPELFETFLATSLVGRAVASGALQVSIEPLREHGLGRHRSVDDTPYGGGAGMLLRVDCVVAAMEAWEQKACPSHRVLLSPQGAPFDQTSAVRFSRLPALLLVCGRYEGFDERVRGCVSEELSLGDFVLCGGEVCAMAVIEACARLLPNVLGNRESAEEESFSAAQEGRLEYAQFTRPPEFRGMVVPEILKGGHHEQVRAWRRQESLERTQTRRPDLMPRAVRDVRDPKAKA